MNFTDYLFFPVFAAVIIVYFVVPQKKRWIVLLAASIVFFLTWSLEMFPFALFAAFVAWIAARKIEKRYEALNAYTKKQKKAVTKKQTDLTQETKKKCRHILWIAAAVILFMLIYSKIQYVMADIPVLSGIVALLSDLYRTVSQFFAKIPILSYFASDTAAQEGGQFSFLVPLGISYYTLSLVGYLADVYWRKERAERNFGKLLLYALYFPKILEGPIAKHRNIAQQLNEGGNFDYTRLCHGLQRMLWGYFKKLVIADRISLLVTEVYGNYTEYFGTVLFVATVAGAVQLYCDFSGCMDIALGISEVFGIELEENFRRPFFSESAAEFWRRWHITMGVWFKDYIYMPLAVSPKLIRAAGTVKKRAGKRAGKNFMTIVPLAVVWFLTGLWHGTGMNYIVWGIYWGALIILSSVLEPELKKLTKLLHINTESSGYRRFRCIRTFLLFCVSRVITIPGDLHATAEIFRRILFHFSPWEFFDGTLYTIGLDRPDFLLALLTLFILYLVGKKQEQGIAIRQKVDSLFLVWRWLIYLAAIFAVLIFGIYGAGYDASAFVYMNY